MNHKSTKQFIQAAALMVLLICLYSYLIGNRVFRGHFENDAISWYILAKGIFCSVTLVVLAELLDLVRRKK
ncbi:MAG TPA: hypothetical protein VGB38_03100 [bacterium]